MKNRYRGDKKIDIAATKKSISRRQKNRYRGDEKIAIAATKNRYRGKAIAPAFWKIAAALQQSAKSEMAWGKRRIRIEHGAPLKREALSNMEHHLREKHREDFNDIGLQLLSPAEESDSWHQWRMYRHNWESRMAVKRVPLSYDTQKLNKKKFIPKLKKMKKHFIPNWKIMII